MTYFECLSGSCVEEVLKRYPASALHSLSYYPSAYDDKPKATQVGRHSRSVFLGLPFLPALNQPCRAGIGGVATAARLQKAGIQVTVIEKNDYTGGRCSLLHHEGYRFDQGPSLLLLPRLFHAAFADLGTSLEAEGVELLKCEPNYNVWFSDGEMFELSTDTARMKDQVEKWEGKDGFSRYLDFLREAHLHYEVSVAEVLQKNFTSLLSMARPSFLKHLFALHPFESIYTRASKYFWTERLRRVFTFGSMYMGMSPMDAPGTYSLLQYTELAEGIWYPRGGFHRIVLALVDVGRRLGVKYRLSTAVSSVKVSPDGVAQGLVLANGETVTADLVIINADLVYAYKHLLPPSSSTRSLDARDASCSSISFYWAMDRTIPELNAHNIFLADEYRESFDEIFKEQSIPRQPSFYVNVPSRIDPSASPAGKDSIVVLVPVGHLVEDTNTTTTTDKSTTPSQDWPRMISHARSTVLRTIEARTGCAPNLSSYIRKELVNTPLSWKTAFNLDKGAILGLSHSFFNVLSFRPRTKHAGVKQCYFVGASTHPGTGVPICLAGSKIVSEQILHDAGMDIPWQDRDTDTMKKKKKIGSSIDEEQRPWSSSSTVWMSTLSLVALLLALLLSGYATALDKP